MSKVDIYICSKPLQYLNICNIPSLDGNNKKILIICNTFYKASIFADNIREYEKQWDKVVLVSGRNWAFHVIRYRVEKLFLGIDSTLVGVLHFVKRFKFYLYEEGAGIYNSNSNFLRIQDKYLLLARILGTGEIMGKSHYLQGIFVYYPDYYISRIHPSCPVFSFVYSYRAMIKQKVRSFLSLYNLDVNNEPFFNIYNSKILLYITDWEFDLSIINRMEEEKDNYDYLFIKPHPHILKESIPIVKGINVLYTSLIVEIIIHIWLERGNKVTVYHQDSTAIIPFGNEINSINLNESIDSEYHQIIEELKKLSCN